jgi:hypothetical protein
VCAHIKDAVGNGRLNAEIRIVNGKVPASRTIAPRFAASRPAAHCLAQFSGAQNRLQAPEDNLILCGDLPFIFDSQLDLPGEYASSG